MNHYKVLHFTVTLFFIFFSALCFSQSDEYLLIKGKVVDDNNRLEDAFVRVEKDGNFDREVRTDGRGKFELELDLFHEFMIYFGKEGYVTKKIQVDTRTIDESQIAGAYLKYGGWTVEIFKDDLGVDIKILDRPIGKVTYDDDYNSFVNDDFYTKAIQSKLDKLMEDLRRARDEQYLEEKRKEEEYQLAIEDGEAFMEEDDLESALWQFRAAMKIKPDEKYPQKQIEKINEKINKNHDLEEQYNQYLTMGDEAFYEEKWKEAKEQYTEASIIKPKEQYPKDQIAICEEKLEDAEKYERLKKEYDKQIAKADNAFEGDAIKEAKGLYESALNILPDEDYPKQQIAEIDKLLDKQAAIDEQFASIMKEGETEMNAESFEAARKKFTEALKLKPKEKEPKKKIAEIEHILRERQEDRKLAAEEQERLKTEYDSLIAEGDAFFDEDKLSDAENRYNEALDRLPEQEYPVSKLNEIAQIRENRKNAEKRYQDLISSAEKNMKKDELQKAKDLYSDALGVKPNEQLPKDKIAEIDKLLAQRAEGEKQERLAREAELKAQKEKYDSLIASADNLLNGEELDEAEKTYREAKNVLPDKPYPDEQLAKIDRIRQQEADLEENYRKLVKAGDNSMKSEAYEEAIASYEDALELKPEESYPKEQIAAAEQKISELEQAEQDRLASERAERERINKEYKDAVAKADDLFNDSAFNESVSAYKEALKIKPEEEYPGQKIKEAEAAIQKIKELKGEREKREQLAREKQEEYESLMANGDTDMEREKYQAAVNKFKEAAQLFPERSEPDQKIKEAEKLIAEKEKEAERSAAEQAERERIEREYKTAMQLAGTNFGNEKYREAIRHYENAKEIKPDESEPDKKIKEIEDLIAQKEKEEEERIKKEAEARRKAAEFDSLIVVADSFYTNDNLNRARDRYEEALEIKEDEYAKARVKEIYETQQAERQRRAKFRSDLRKFNYELAEKYPEGRTEETSEEGNKKVTRIIIVRGDAGHEFIKEEYSWGDTYYKKNQRPYARQNWEQEVKEF